MTDKAKSKKQRKIIIIAITGVLLLSAAAAAVFMPSKINIAGVKQNFSDKNKKEYTVKLDSFIVNLSGEDNSSNYLKAGISLMYTDNKKTEMLKTKTSQIRDIIIRELMSYSAQDLLAPGGLDSVKEKLRTEINKNLGDDVIKEVYFTDFMIQ